MLHVFAVEKSIYRSAIPFALCGHRTLSPHNLLQPTDTVGVKWQPNKVDRKVPLKYQLPFKETEYIAYLIYGPRCGALVVQMIISSVLV